MLVLTRKQGEGFFIGEKVEITLLEVSGDKVRIAINAPREVAILRKELAQAREANLESLESAPRNLAGLTGLKNALHAQGLRQDPQKRTDAPDSPKE